MPWIEEPLRCQHPDRPEPRVGDQNRIWECPQCLNRWRVIVVDFGHDVMHGEKQWQAQWWHIDIAGDPKPPRDFDG